MLDSPMLWIAVVGAAVAVAAHFWRRLRDHAADCQRLEEILREVADGRVPAGVLFSDRAGRFSELTPHLDRIVAELGGLRARAAQGDSRWEAILASMQEGVMVADSQHILRSANPAFVAMFKTPHDPRGQSVLHTLREAAFDEMVTTVLTTGETCSSEVEISGTKPRRYISVNVTPIRDKAGGAGVVAIFRDTTRLHQLEDVRRNFVANVSHELRTPLSIFQGYLEMLVDAPDMPRAERMEVIEVLRRNSRRLNAILEDLLTLARMESRHEPLTCEAIDIADFLRSAMKDWERTALEKRLTIVADIAPALPPLHADRLRIEQVIANLLDNAVKYTDPGGRIAVCARATEGHLELRIEDSGRGIPPADLPHIFERFYRADKARSREQGGTGLGLSIVKHIVQSHTGTVAAESTYERGTAIIVRLPFAGPPIETVSE